MKIKFYAEPQNKEMFLDQFEETQDKADFIYTHFESVKEKCKAILCPATNVDHLGSVDPDIKVFHLTDSKFLLENVKATAEHTISLMLQTAKLVGKELSGANVVLLGGNGRVATQVSKMLQGFTNEIYKVDLHNLNLLGDYLRDADIFSIHINSNISNEGFVDYDILSYCEKKPIVINTARGAVLDGYGLLEAYDKGVITGFGLDVVDTYNNDIKEAIAMCPHAVWTNHVAGKSIKSRLATDEFVLKEAVRWAYSNPK